jgi:hypothetical protein
VRCNQTSKSATAEIIIRSAPGDSLGFTLSAYFRQHGIEDRLQFSGRATDDTQHLGGRRLLRPRLVEFAPVFFELLF